MPLYSPPTGYVASPDYYQDYEARIQPGLGGSGQVVISYNVNTSAVDTGCVSANDHEATIYRPRFIDVPVSDFDPSAAVPAPATALTRANVPVSALSLAGTRAAAPAQVGAPAAGQGGSPLPGYGIRDSRPAFTPGSVPVSAPAETKAPLASPADSSGGSIDGATDWYDKPLGGSCPQIQAPSAPALTLDTAADNGWVSATWQNMGTDVWYWAYVCDQAENPCTSPGSGAQGWVQAWPYGGANLWATDPSGEFDPIDSTTTTGNNTNGHPFGIVVKSFGAGYANGGAYSPVASITILR